MGSVDEEEVGSLGGEPEVGQGVECEGRCIREEETLGSGMVEDGYDT